MADGWWNLNGAITSCVAAYQPKGAASYAASLVNLTGNAAYDATEGTAPVWDSTNGWDFVSYADLRHLWTGITPANDQTWSMIIRFDDSSSDRSQAMAGCINTAGSSSIFYLCPRRGSAGDDMIFGNGGLAIVGARQSSGVMAICGANCYLNAELQGTVSTGWDAVGIEIAIGGMNYRSGAGKTFYTNSSFDGRIQAMAIYSGDISSYIGDLTTAVNALKWGDNLTAADFTLAAVTFDAPTLANVWVTPACRTFTVEAESRTFTVEAESRGLKILCSSATIYAPTHAYNGLTAKDLTLSPIIFDAATLSEDFNALIVFDGNSMTADAYSSYPATTVSALVGTWTAHNFGVSGQTTIEMIADADTQIDPLYDANMLKNVVVFWEVANDLYHSATRADAQARMVQYCQARQAAGWTVVVLTLLPRSKFDTVTYEDDRIAINSYIRANYATFADAVADAAGDSRIGDDGDCDDTTYYTDGCHMTTAGYNIVAGIVATTVNAL